jgi:hypothetical protein
MSRIEPARRLALAAAALATLAAACEGSSTGAPWLTMPTREGHRAVFPLIGTSHSATDCNACHTGPDFTPVACTTCHLQPETDAIHLGFVPSYEWRDAACITCHHDGTLSPADHAERFPIGQGTSHAVLCRQCHGDATRRNDPATLLCADCHATRPGFSTAHAAVTDFDTTPAACIRCHAEQPVPTVAAHQARFPIAVNSTTHTTACLHCHARMRTDKPYAADFAQNTCTDCHAKADTDPHHVGIADYVWTSEACFQCHPDGTPAFAQHEARFPIAAGTDHAGMACDRCHTVATRRSDVTTLACASCHVALSSTLATKHTGAAIPVTDYQATSAMCVRCHAESQVDRAASHPRGEDTPSNNSWHRTAGCTRCHSGFRSAKPWAASWSTTPGCRSCHN